METNKFLSRKFLMCLAAALGAAGTTITGLCIQNQVVIVIGAICLAVSTGIYTFCEAWIDAKAVKVNTPENVEN